VIEPLPEDLRWLRGLVRAAAVRYPVRYERLEPFLDALIASAERPRVVLAPANDEGAWWLGWEGSQQLHVGAPAALSIAHRAIGGARIPIAQIVSRGSNHPDNAAREQVRTAERWVKRRADCAPLVHVLRAVGVRGGHITYRTPDLAPIVRLQ